MVATSLDKPGARSEVRLTDWLTVERAAYAGIVVLALGLRLYGLGRVPLGPAEAVQALPAWAAAAGQPYDLIGVSPLQFGPQWLLFALFGAGDAVARLWPALIGGLTPLLFYVLRDRLTRGGALIGGLLWAVSGVAVFTGRLGLGESLVAPLALALLAALNVWARQTAAAEETGATSQRNASALGGGGAGVGVDLGPGRVHGPAGRPHRGGVVAQGAVGALVQREG